MPHAQSAIEDLPAPTAESVLIRVLVEAHLATIPRKQGERFLRLAGEKLAHEDNLSNVFHIRPSSQHAAITKARRQAAALYLRLLPIFLARVGGGD